MNKRAFTFMIIAVAALTIMCVAKVGYDTMSMLKKPVIVQRRVMHPRQFGDQYLNRSTPEYRPPPYKRWMPSVYQQLGVLTNQDGEILPLYGRESSAYRNRWNYYTSTPGNQIYPLPIKSGDRDCTEDIGCNEMYGQEDVSVMGKDATYKAEIYKNAF